MSVTISEFRKELFQLVEKAAQGEVVEFTHKGNVFTVTPKKKRNRLDGYVGLPSRGGPEFTLEVWEQHKKEQQEESERRFEEKWPEGSI